MQKQELKKYVKKLPIRLETEIGTVICTEIKEMNKHTFVLLDRNKAPMVLPYSIIEEIKPLKLSAASSYGYTSTDTRAAGSKTK